MWPREGLMKRMQPNQELEQLRDKEEVHYGGEGPHLAAVPMKEKVFSS